MIDCIISNVSVCSFQDVSFIVNFLTMLLFFSAMLLIFLSVSWIYFLTSFTYLFAPSLKSWIVWRADFEFCVWNFNPLRVLAFGHWEAILSWRSHVVLPSHVSRASLFQSAHLFRTSQLFWFVNCLTYHCTLGI